MPTQEPQRRHHLDVFPQGREGCEEPGRWPYLACAQQQRAEVDPIQGDIGQWGPGQGCQGGQ